MLYCYPPFEKKLRRVELEIGKEKRNALVGIQYNKHYQNWHTFDNSEVCFDILFKWMQERSEKTSRSSKAISDIECIGMLECSERYKLKYNKETTFRIGVTKDGETYVEAWTYFEEGKKPKVIPKRKDSNE